MRVPHIATGRVIRLARRAPTGSPLLVALGHPSLGSAVDRFVGDVDDPALRSRLTGDALLGTVAVEDGTVTGIAHLDDGGDVTVVVSPGAGGRGTASELLGQTLRRGRDLGVRRFRLSPSHRSRPLRRVARELGLVVVETGPGEVELLVLPGSVSHSA